MSVFQTLAILTLFLQVADKPRDRNHPETKTQNLARYQLGGFGLESNGTIGADLKYSDTEPQGASIVAFAVDSLAREDGLQMFDVILEVNGSAVGRIRERYYEPWKFYRRHGPTIFPELLISYVRSNATRGYYYKFVRVAPIGEIRVIPPEDFFTSAKPRDRDAPESAFLNKARYVVGYGNFGNYARYELGVNVQYTYAQGAVITNVKPGKAADRAGLRVGDMILEADGAPIGVFNGRTYEVWRQFFYTNTGEVEFLIAFKDPATNATRYYYPFIQLDPLASPN